MSGKRQKLLRTKALEYRLTFPQMNMSIRECVKKMKKLWKGRNVPVKEIKDLPIRSKSQVVRDKIERKVKEDQSEWDE